MISSDTSMLDSKKSYYLNAVAVTPDQRFIVGGGSKYAEDHPGSIRFWDFNTGALIRSDKWPDYQLELMVGTDKDKLSHFLESILVTPDSRRVVVSGRDFYWPHVGFHYVFVGDIETTQRIRRFSPGHNNTLQDLRPMVVTPNGRYLLSQKEDTLNMWDMQTGELVRSFESCKGAIKSIAVTDDSQYAVVLVYGQGCDVRVINLQTDDLKLQIFPEQL